MSMEGLSCPIRPTGAGTALVGVSCWMCAALGCLALLGVWACSSSSLCAVTFQKEQITTSPASVCYINRQCHLKSSLGANDGSSESGEEGWELQWLFPVVLAVAVVACCTTWRLWPQRFRDGQRLGENLLIGNDKLLQCKVLMCYCLVLSVLSTLVSCSNSPLHIVTSLIFSCTFHSLEF